MMHDEVEAVPKAKKVKKEEKKARKRAKKDAKRSAKRARKESKKSGGSSSSSSDDEGEGATLRQLGDPVPLPAAARWQGPALAPVPSIASLKAQLAAAQSARVARAAAGPAPTAFGSSQIMPSQAEIEMRGLRAARFEQTAAEKALAAAACRPVPKLPAGQVLKGSSQALEKSYLRLTSMPRADQARPSTAPHRTAPHRTAPHRTAPQAPHTRRTAARRKCRAAPHAPPPF